MDSLFRILVSPRKSRSPLVRRIAIGILVGWQAMRQTGLAQEPLNVNVKEPAAWSDLSTLRPAQSLRVPSVSLPHPHQPTSPTEPEAHESQQRSTPSSDLDRTPDRATEVAQPSSSTSTSGGVDLASLESMALQFNPSLQRSAAEIAAGQGRAWQAGLKPNPIAGIDYQQIGSRGQAEQFGALLQQEFVAREKLQLSRQVAGHEVQKLEQQFAAQRLRILTDVRVAFVRSLRAQRQIELTTELLSISSTSLQIAEQLKEAEEVSRIDVLQAEMEVEQARIARQNAQNRRAAAWLELAAVVGQPNMPMQPLTGPLRTPTDERRFEQVLQNLRLTSPEVKAVSAQIQRERCNLRRQEIEPRPNLTVQGLVNWQDNGIGGSADGGLVVSLPIPVWNRNQGAIKSAYHGLIAAERQLNTVELELQQRLAQVFERYGNALQQTTRYEQLILPKSAETLKLTRTAYENGEIDYVNLLTIQRTFAQNQLAYLEVLESLRVTEAEMDGLLLSSSLASLSGTPLR